MAIPLPYGFQLVGDLHDLTGGDPQDLSVGDIQDLSVGDLQVGGPNFDDPVPLNF